MKHAITVFLIYISMAAQPLQTKLLFGISGWLSSDNAYIAPVFSLSQSLKNTESGILLAELSYELKGYGPSYAESTDNFISLHPEKTLLQYLSVSLKYQLLLNSWEKRNNASLLFGPNSSVLLTESATHQKFKTGFYAGIRFDFKKKNTLDLGIDLMLTPLFKNPNLNRSFANRVHSILLRMGFSL